MNYVKPCKQIGKISKLISKIKISIEILKMNKDKIGWVLEVRKK